MLGDGTTHGETNVESGTAAVSLFLGDTIDPIIARVSRWMKSRASRTLVVLLLEAEDPGALIGRIAESGGGRRERAHTAMAEALI